LIVFPGLEIILGIETLVGKESVSYINPQNHSEGYMFTNPGAMIKWIASVILIGVLTIVAGITILLKQKIN
jgi:hypothetical protein